MIANPRILLVKRPDQGCLPVIGQHLVFDTSRVVDLDNVALNGGFLTKTLILSPEPYMRDRLRDPSIPSYATSIPIGAPIVGPGVVVVLRSEKEGIKPGDYMYGQTPWEAYTIQPYIEGRVHFKPEEWAPDTFDPDSAEAFALRVVPDPKGLYPLSSYANAFGLPGSTAFVGFHGLLEAVSKEGNTIFVSSGASGVGSVVIQLAKLKGMKVIASAGSDAKVDFMRSLGADIAFNYKTNGYQSILTQHAPIHAFWDNVGGEALDAALESLAPLGRAVLCGTVASDNVPVENRYRLKNTHLIMKKRLDIQGFLISDHVAPFINRLNEELPSLLMQGKLKTQEYYVEGIENGAQALLDCWTGVEAVGKPVVVIAKA